MIAHHSLKIASVLVRLDHVARFIENANQRHRPPIKRFGVGIHPALLPGQEEQYTGKQQGDSGLQPSLPTP